MELTNVSLNEGMSQYLKYLNVTITIDGTTVLPRGLWNLASSFTLFSAIAGTTANFAVLSVFFTRPQLRTSFSVYLINLLLANLIMSVVLEPMNLLNEYYASWTIGYRACAFRNYVGWTISDAVLVSHFLIALNRLWAVTFPVSYRNRHTKMTAVCICVSAWVVINAVIIPTIPAISTLSIPNVHGRQRCGLNTGVLGVWGSILQLVFYDLPILLVLIFFPIVCYKSFIGSRYRRRVRATASAAVDTRRSADTQPKPDDPAALGRRRETARPSGGNSRQGSRRGFMMLTLMTLSAIVCLAPNEVYFTILMVIDYDPPGLSTAVKVLQSLTTVFDPLLIILANRDLRTEITRQFRQPFVRAKSFFARGV